MTHIYVLQERGGDRNYMQRGLGPGDTTSQASPRRSGGYKDYSSDSSMAYQRRETRDHDDDHSYHHRHPANGALAGVGAAELIRKS